PERGTRPPVPALARAARAARSLLRVRPRARAARTLLDSRAVLSFARRRHVVTYIALGGLAVTWAVMLAFDWTAKLGTIALAPWVALIGFDLGVAGGICAAAIALCAWLIATDV